MKNLHRFFSVFAIVAMLAGCASTDFGSPNVYMRSDVQRSGTIDEGTVERVRPITIQTSASNSGLVSIVSAAAGAFLSSRVFGNGNGRYIAAAVGGAATSVLTDRISTAQARCSGLEIVVRLKSGSRIVVAQPDDQSFAPGEHVFVMNGGSGLRVTH